MHTQYNALFKYQCVREYISGNLSLRKLAREKHIHFTTLKRWVSEYKKHRDYPLAKEILGSYKIPYWLIKLLIKAKEENPNLTIQEAKIMLQNKGINLSPKEIWRIWQDWGYAGFNKKYLSNKYTSYIFVPKSVDSITKFLKEQGSRIPAEELRKILSNIPALSDEDVILRLKPTELPPHHRLAKLYLSFGKTPPIDYLNEAKDLKRRFSKRKFLYSFLRANYAEIFALDWMGKRNEEYKIIKKTEGFYSNLKDECLRFSFFILKARCCMSLLKFDEGIASFKICKKILMNYKEKPLAFLADMATFCASFGFYKEAEKYLNLMRESEEHQQLGSFHMAEMSIKIAKGEFDSALNINEKTKHIWGYESRRYLIEAYKALTS